MVLRRCLLPKESSRIDETIENRVVWRMAVLVLFQLNEHQNGHAPNDAVLDGFVYSGRFLRKQASTAHLLDFKSIKCLVLADLLQYFSHMRLVDLVI